LGLQRRGLGAVLRLRPRCCLAVFYVEHGPTEHNRSYSRPEFLPKNVRGQTVLKRDLGQCSLRLACLGSEILDFIRDCFRTASPASRFLPASRNSFDHFH